MPKNDFMHYISYKIVECAAKIRMHALPQTDFYSRSNVALFVSIKRHQKKPLGCAVYSHCPTNDSATIIYTAGGYLAIMLVSLFAYCSR